MSQETPIYSRLVAERGDVPSQVRGEARRIRRDLARIMRDAPPPVAGPTEQRFLSDQHAHSPDQ
ncbi:hypothetical protein ACWCP6_19715 [Streptomyces sp. NPDC002004]